MLVQNKKIKKCIARENLFSNEQVDMDTMAAMECNMESFFQGLPSVDALPADFALGSHYVISFLYVLLSGAFAVVALFSACTDRFFFCS